ncbi:hypothetical protein [Dyella sp.]|jgi:hypothetical protein|uniref:hypothetical protein n=1 Tax=Dyella sp. TaxID=1869338 RepID=UPI002D779B59|nr:hypothetical protein [Dyella sp.]HET6433673.1 hypothetical protein [Dyella sp.]
MSLLGATALVLAGAWLIYLGSPAQNWLRAPLARLPRRSGALLLALSVMLWCRILGVGAGIAAFITLVMLAWVLAPYLGWWLGRRDAARSAR